jgi:transcriptional regulator with XRE-family HTH domain
MAQSEAAKKLEKALFPQKEQLTVAGLAEKLGVSRQAVHAWLKGDSVPRAKHMAEIENLTGIPMQEWFAAAGENGSDDNGDEPREAASS